MNVRYTLNVYSGCETTLEVEDVMMMHANSSLYTVVNAEVYVY